MCPTTQARLQQVTIAIRQIRQYESMEYRNDALSLTPCPCPLCVLCYEKNSALPRCCPSLCCGRCSLHVVVHVKLYTMSVWGTSASANLLQKPCSALYCVTPRCLTTIAAAPCTCTPPHLRFVAHGSGISASSKAQRKGT